MNTRLVVTFSLTAACILAQAVPPARADSTGASDYNTVSRTVRYGDLNLATEAGKRVLKTRLQTAAGEVCNETVGTHYGMLAENSKCRGALVDNALAEVFGKTSITTERLAATHKSGMITVTSGRAP